MGEITSRWEEDGISRAFYSTEGEKLNSLFSFSEASQKAAEVFDEWREKAQWGDSAEDYLHHFLELYPKGEQ